MSDEQTIKSYEVVGFIGEDNIRFTVIRHENASGMRVEVEEKYSDEDHFKLQSIGSVHGLTLAKIDQGSPEIRVYIPMGYTTEEYVEIVSHEAVHATASVMRYRQTGSMYGSSPVSLTDEPNEISGCCEESFAELVGETSRFIWDAVEKIDAMLNEKGAVS